MNNVYEIIWICDDDLVPTQHRTEVEVSKLSMRSALSKFDTIYHKIIREHSAYSVVSCNFLGTVIKKCW